MNSMYRAVNMYIEIQSSCVQCVRVYETALYLPQLTVAKSPLCCQKSCVVTIEDRGLVSGQETNRCICVIHETFEFLTWV